MSAAADPTAVFLRAIQQSGLLDYEQYSDLFRWAAEAKPDVQGVAKEVYRRKWLTPYQIKEIFKGRGRTLILGPYVLQELLGEGGMGKVFKAHHLRLGRDVALKIIRKEKLANPAAEGRFRAEIQALAQMSHPNVVAAYDADQVGETHFCVMEYIDGTDLAQIVRNKGPLPIPEACEYIRQAALGLHHAYEMGLVHRDVKPSNLLVTRNGRQVKVVDLGLARVGEAPLNPDANRITQEGFVLGTPDFLAPEQARNPGGVDIRADVYALGGTLYFILTGEPPFEGKTPADKLVKHCTEPPPNLLVKRPDAPPHLAQLIQWFMAKQPEHRPQTPAEMIFALQPYCESAVQGSPGAYVPHPTPWAGVKTDSTLHPMYPGTTTHQPQPVYAQPHPQAYPAPEVDPAPSSQIFRLPPTAEGEDPIRRRIPRKKSYTTPILFLFGGFILLGILGFAAYRTLHVTPPPPLQKEFTNDVGMKFLLLDGGTFKMGSAEDETGRGEDEGPQHEVTLREKFYLGTTEVTQGQFIEVMGMNSSAAGKAGRSNSDMPMENVSFTETLEFCKRLTKDHSKREGWAYRLPTEAEWEFACRAGSAKPFVTGDRLSYPNQAIFSKGTDETDPTGESVEADVKPPSFPDKVGKRPANAWGFFDMHGNVAEWCSDFYARSYPAEAHVENPHGPADGGRHVVRGGSFRDPSTHCRSAARRGELPATRLPDVGFRVVYAPITK